MSVDGHQTDLKRLVNRAAELRREVELHDRTPRKRGWIGRILTWTARLLTFAVLLVLAANAWIAYDVFIDDDGPVEVVPGQPSYDHLEIFDNAGSFGGRVTITNPLERDVEVLVEVDIYDGEQNVGDLHGSVSLKPDSESSVDLTGFDDFVEYSDVRVHLGGWPK